MNESNLKIALFDMDGTLCDYVSSMKAELEKLRAPGEPLLDPFIEGNKPDLQFFWDRMNLIKSNENWWANLPRHSLGFDVLELTKELGYHNEVLTQAPKTNPAALAGKLRWILNNLDEDTDFTMTRNKSRHYGRVLVDDYPGFILPWIEHRPRGLVIMPSNKYNKGFTHEQVMAYNGQNKEQVEKALIEAMNK
jgi:5'-nucleotidase